MDKKQSLNYKLAITGAFGALSVILGVTRWGMISLSPVVSLTIMHIPVILATLLAGLVPGIGVGAIFGVSSLILAATSQSSLLDPLFINPLVSVLPRMLIAVITWAVDVLLKKIPAMPRIVSGSISAFFGSLSNTVLVIGSLFLLNHDSISKELGNSEYFAGLAVLMPNALLEAAAAVIITAAVFGGMYAVQGRKSKLSHDDDDK